MSLRAAALAVAGLLVAAACGPASQPEPTAETSWALTPVSFTDLPSWQDDDHAAALDAFRRSCPRTAAIRVTPPGAEPVAGDTRAACTAAAAVADTKDAAQGFFEQWFRPYQVASETGDDGLFTGYYEPQLRGSRQHGGRFTVPLHRRPPELITADLGAFRSDWEGERLVGQVVDGRLVPLPTRGEIQAGALDGRGLELLWVDSAVDAFFLHVQGSGVVALNQGGTVRVGFDGRNGHPYTAIGRELVSRGALSADAVTMQSIRTWLNDNPTQAATVMAANRSYIFFRFVDGDGPLGAQGVPLTPGRSLAVDRRFLPLGVPVWLDTTDPLRAGQPLRRLVVAQDTGSAIGGPVRGDLFWGAGDDAAAAAGAMKQRGRYFVLIPRRGPEG